MTVGIYGIFCSDTGECLYVGQSKDIESRYYQHLKNLRNGNHRRKDFVDWFKVRSDNPDKMIFAIIEETPDSDFEKNKVEIFWFKELQPRFFGKVPSLNDKWTHSEETRKRIGLGVKEVHISNNLSFFKTVNCLECSNQIQLTWSTRNRKFCSTKCCYKSSDVKKVVRRRMADNPKVEYRRTCGTCQKEYIMTRKDKNAVFCSRDCQISSYEKTSILSPEIIHELYHVQKLSLRKIASRFNMSHVALTKYMDSNNIPKRDKNDKVYKV